MTELLFHLATARLCTVATAWTCGGGRDPLTAVAEDLPLLHTGEGALDSGPQAPVRGIAFLLTAQMGASDSSVVRDDQPGVQGGVVRHGEIRPVVLGYQQHPLGQGEDDGKPICAPEWLDDHA